jgi:WD40 repeat protein
MAPTGGGDENKTHTILEQIELSDESDDDFAYEELKDEELAEDDEVETLDDIHRLLAETKPSGEGKQGPTEADIVKVSQRPQVIDDFIRNFLLKYDMKRSLDVFQTEWYELQQSGKFKDSELQVVPDDYTRGQCLIEEVVLSRQELEKARMVAEKAKETWDKFRKERDFHRMHHRRVVQEKNKLIIDLKRLKRHYEQYEPTLTELRHKYEVAMKEKTLMRLERDRFANKVESLQKQLTQMQFDSKEEALGKDVVDAGDSTRRTRPREAPWPSEERTNPYWNANFEASRAHEMKRTQHFKGGHLGPISRVAFHPKIPVIATVSDDHTWKMWSMPEGQLVLSGEGHKDWVSGIAFHPRGSLVATTSGDCTTKIWDVEKEKCKHTLTDHNQAVWSCAFHDLGDFLVTASMDQTVKAFDMQSMKCRQTFRGHVDSVNYVTFQPCSNTLLSASGDKTVSLWDLRSGLCVQTFYGHANCVNQAQFNLRGDTIASCDSDGIVKLWDIKNVSEYLQIDTGQLPANASAFDRSGKVLAIASGDASVKLFNVDEKNFLTNLEGHEDSVQDVAFGQNDKFLVTASSDGCFCLYQ